MRDLKTYLNAGTGNPWAGQINPTEVELITLEEEMSEVDGNFGAAVPIGSRNGNFSLCTTYSKWPTNLPE